MKKITIFSLLFMLLFGLISACSFPGLGSETQESYQELNSIIGSLCETASTEEENVLIEKMQHFDNLYNAKLTTKYLEYKKEITSNSRITPHHVFPLDKDGAVFLSGGIDSVGSGLISFLSPKKSAGRYYHAAILDKDKYDPANPEKPCFHTAGLKGAAYESVADWRKKEHVAVLYPKSKLSALMLNCAQGMMDGYCNKTNHNMIYGFFTIDSGFFQPVTKDNAFAWYCTKVVWKIYSFMGYNIDSDYGNIDWKTSGLYGIVKSYYYTKYTGDNEKAEQAISSYLEYMKKTLIIADEIYYSPLFKLTYEVLY